jgi:hypothetical protein
MATLVALLPEVDAHRVHARLGALAQALDDPTDTRTMDQKRADILTDVLLGAGAEPTGPGSRPQISVVVTLGTLLGLGDDPGQVPGLGPVPAAVARELAADGTWRAWVTDTTGKVVTTGSKGYTPNPGLARLIRAREPHCRMPGCRKRASSCDIDHTIAYPNGPTQAHNLGVLCRRHHVLKTHYGHDLANHPDGGWTWTTPAGITHYDEPPQPAP